MRLIRSVQNDDLLTHVCRQGVERDGLARLVVDLIDLCFPDSLNVIKETILASRITSIHFLVNAEKIIFSVALLFADLS